MGYVLSGEIALKNNHYYYYIKCLAQGHNILKSRFEQLASVTLLLLLFLGTKASLKKIFVYGLSLFHKTKTIYMQMYNYIDGMSPLAQCLAPLTTKVYKLKGDNSILKFTQCFYLIVLC